VGSARQGPGRRHARGGCHREATHRLALLLIALAPTGEVHAQQTPLIQPGTGPSGVSRQEGYFDLLAGVSYTDNAFLVPSGATSTSIGTAGVDVDYQRQGPRLDLQARGNVAWQQYLDNAFPGRVFGRFDSTATWGHSTDLFQWMVRDTLDEGAANPLAAPTPNELETINYFTTGPYLNFNFNTNERLSFYGLYSRTSFQKSPFDYHTYDWGTIFAHRLAAFSSLSLQLDSAQTTFDRPALASNYTDRTARVIYTGAIARIQVLASAGYTIENYGGPSSGGRVWDLELSRRISPSSYVYVRAHDGFTTIGGVIRSGFGASVSTETNIGAVPRTATPAPLEYRLGTLGWTFNGQRTSLSLVGSLTRQLYLRQATFDSTIKTITGTAQRRLQPTVSLRLQAYRSDTRYGTIDAAVIDTVFNLSLLKQFRKVGMSVFAQRTHRASSSAGAAASLGLLTRPFDENRIGLNVSYDLVGKRYSGAALELLNAPVGPTNVGPHR
jgi:hypothetical protein